MNLKWGFRATDHLLTHFPLSARYTRFSPDLMDSHPPLPLQIAALLPSLPAPCTVLTGDSHVILNMVESLGEQTTQGTTPEQLPISGLPGDDIRLELSYSEESEQYSSHFELDGKALRLRKSLDRDEKDLSSILFQVWIGPIKDFNADS